MGLCPINRKEKNLQTEFTIHRDGKSRDGEEIELTLEWEFIPESRGHRDRYGAPEEPDEPAYLELQSAKDSNGMEWELTDAEMKEAESQADEAYAGSRVPEPDEPDYELYEPPF